MEKMSPTQQTYSTEHLDSKNKALSKIKENLNYIYIVLMIIINTLFSLFTIEDGQIAMMYPTSTLGWILWAVSIFIKTLIGVLILNAFRRQGIKIGHNTIKDIYNKYLEICQKYHNKRPRSLKEYMTKEAVKDSSQKAIFFAIISVFVGSVVISSNINNLLSLVIDILFAIGFGIKTMLDAEEFVVTELVIWYQLKIAEVTDQKLEPAKGETNGVSKQRVVRKSRPTKSGGVQQEKKRRTRPKTINASEPSSAIN